MAAIVATDPGYPRPSPYAVADGAGEHVAGSRRQLGTDVAEALIDAMEARDPYLRGHSQRVADLAGRIAEALGLDAAVVDDIRLAGRLHDVGMVGIRESILNKPDVLTPDEIRQVREHVRLGVEILSPLPGLGRVLEYVHDHHERHDGCGYPRGAAGEAISLGGRILAAADAFDALTSPRAYRAPLAPEACLSRLAGDVGRALDPRVFAALREVVMHATAPRPAPAAACRAHVSIGCAGSDA